MARKKELKLKMKQRFFLPNFNGRLLFINDILCSKCRIFQCKKEKLDVDFSIFGNEIDQSQSTSHDPSISIRLKPEVEKSNIEKIEVLIQRTISSTSTVVFVLLQRISQLFQKKLVCNLILK